jgi:hypothetical protein
MSLPILVVGNGNPMDGGDTIASPPRVRDDGKFLMISWDDSEFLMASSATGPCTTPPHLAVVVEGTSLVLGCLQENWYAGGSYSSSEDDDSQPLLDLPEVLEAATATASTTDMATALAPKDLEAVLAAVSELEHHRNCEFDANMTALCGRNIQVEQNLSDVRGDIALIRGDTSHLMTKSVALVELNKATCLAVASSVSGFLQAMEASKAQHPQAMEVNAAQNHQALEVNAAQNCQALEAHKASFQQYVDEANKSIMTITAAHTQSMTDMQTKLHSSFDRMKYLKKTFKNVPARITDHLDKTVPQVIASVVDWTLPITLTMALKDMISPTLKMVLDDTITNSIALLMEGSFTDVMTQFSLIVTDMA